MISYLSVISGGGNSKLCLQSRWSPGDGVVSRSESILGINQETIIRELLLVNSVDNNISISSENQKLAPDKDIRRPRDSFTNIEATYDDRRFFYQNNSSITHYLTLVHSSNQHIM